MFKAINTVVQTAAKIIAYALAWFFTLITWLIFQSMNLISWAIRRFIDGICYVFAGFIWVLYKINAIIAALLTLIMIVPAKIAQYCFMFALDISPAEQKERIAAMVKAYDEAKEKQMILDSYATRRKEAEKPAPDIFRGVDEMMKEPGDTDDPC